ncbi:MAG: hypothetical protein Q9187_003215 [Circinaria calcarea]
MQTGEKEKGAYSISTTSGKLWLEISTTLLRLGETENLFFLATPHRGADSAQLLGNLLRIAMPNESKAYIHDLIPNSGALQTINDEFRHVYQGSHLWSFFETVKTNLITSQELIVEKDSASIGVNLFLILIDTLLLLLSSSTDFHAGLPFERIQLLNADHRHICKFANPLDNNYLTLRNAFISTIDSIERDWSVVRQEEHRSQMKILSRFLGVAERPEGSLLSVVDKQMDGTCQWLTDKPSFQDWQVAQDNTPGYYWLSGKPATGKSTVAGHVIRHLENCSSDCSYYFFKKGDRENSTLSDMIRCLAFQMAFTNFRVRQVLLDMQDDGESFSKDDERTIWRTIFIARIFRVELSQPHYWVIDALDECLNHTAFIPMLSKVDKNFPLRVFITSRPSPSMERLFVQGKIPVIPEQITLEDSLKDIRLFLEANSSFLPVDGDIACDELIKIILDKSNGCFLWAALVLKELETTHSEQQILEVLKEVPTEMDDLYTRILNSMRNHSRDKELAKAIFRWTVCAARPLTVDELKEALKLDINETLPRLDKSIGPVCGNLIQVDKLSRVQVVHQTVKAFLVKDGFGSEFAVDRIKENSRLAEVCLKYLAGDEMKSPRNRRGSAARRLTKRSLFASYASLYFSEHVARSSSATDTHFMLLETFLNTNTLTWIEFIAQSGDLYSITQTAKNLRAFLDRRAKYRSPLGQAVYAVNAWANDMIHLVAAFGKSLAASPASIYSLIPSVCPPNSMLYQTFGRSQPCLNVVGSSEKDWDDRLTCIVFPEERVTAIACQDARFVVGLANGTIMVYYTSTLQEARRLEHEEPIRHLRFANVGNFLASSGRRKVRLWNVITAAQLWEAEHRNDILTLSFNEEETLLMAATRTNQIAFWDISNGMELDTCPLHETVPGNQSEYRPPSTHAQFSTELGLLAVAHRQRPISIWDLVSNSFIGQFYVAGTKRFPGPLVCAMVFNPNPEINLIAASYQEGHLVVFDPWNQEEQALIKTVAHVLAASPDGKTLAAGCGGGSIQLFDFETLRLMYRVAASDYNVNAIVFTNNNLRFFDIRNDHCNVWEPAVLVRQIESGDGQSENVSEEVPSGPQIRDAHLWDDDLTITVMVVHHNGDVLFCGREDGSVAVFETKTGKPVQVLHSHAKNIAVLSLCWNPVESILVSTDISGRFLARKVSPASPGKWTAEKPLLDERSAKAIRQVLMNPAGKLLLLSTVTSDELWSISAGLIRSRDALLLSSRTWITHPLHPNRLLLIDGSIARIFEWDTLEELVPMDPIMLYPFLKPNTSSTDPISCHANRNVCVTFSNARGARAVPHLLLWHTSSLQHGTEKAKLLADYTQLKGKIKASIGIHKASFLFLDHDGWVCSIKTENAGAEKYYIKHFFIPYGWHSGAEPVLVCTAAGYVVLAKRDEIAVFQKGLAFEERIALE